MTNPICKVVFFQVRKSSDKIINICKIANSHFAKAVSLLFYVSDNKSQKYVDELLWMEPKFSFLPHTSTEEKVEDCIVISQKMDISKAEHIFNLTPNPIIDQRWKIIYEFDDLSDKQRTQISKNKFRYYRGKGYLIESR